MKQPDEDTLEALERATCSLSEITDCYSMSGESDYLLRIVVENIEAHESFLKKELLHLPGVAAVHFALKCIKKTTRLPIKLAKSQDGK